MKIYFAGYLSLKNECEAEVELCRRGGKRLFSFIYDEFYKKHICPTTGFPKTKELMAKRKGVLNGKEEK